MKSFLSEQVEATFHTIAPLETAMLPNKVHLFQYCQQDKVSNENKSSWLINDLFHTDNKHYNMNISN